MSEREPRQNAEPQADAVIELGHGAERTRFLVEAKRTVTPATIGPITQHVARLGEDALLITHHVTPPLAEHLKREEIAFPDMAEICRAPQTDRLTLTAYVRCAWHGPDADAAAGRDRHDHFDRPRRIALRKQPTPRRVGLRLLRCRSNSTLRSVDAARI